MDVTCKNCGAGLEVDDAQSGQLETCPACDQVFEVPLIRHAKAKEETVPQPPEMEPAPLKLTMSSGTGIRGGLPGPATRQGTAGNVIAAFASFIFPGLGQLCQGRVMMAVIFFLASILMILPSVLIGIPLFLLGLPVVCIVAIVDAATWKGPSPA